MLKNINEKFTQEVWQQDVHTLRRSRQIMVYWLRLSHLLVQDLRSGYLATRAASLAYTSILSLVPLLAFAFALLKGLGFEDKLEPLLLNLFSPLGLKSVEMAGKVMIFVSAIHAGALGFFGLFLLSFTAVSLTRKVDVAFNFVWRVRDPRPLAATASHYLAIIILGPVFLALGVGIMTTLNDQALLDHTAGWSSVSVVVVVIAAKLLSYLIVAAALTFLYIFIPFTHVQFRSAVTGGLVAGALWQLTGTLFGVLSAGTGDFPPVYAASAILLMFMLLLYVDWLIVLLGTQICFYVQHPDLVLTGTRRNEIGGATFERVALHIMFLLGRAYSENNKPWSREQLARRLHLPADIILDVIDRLQQRGLILRIPSKRNIARYVPARDMGTITLRDIVMSVRQNPRSGQDADKHMKHIPHVQGFMGKLETAIDGVLGSTTLQQFVEDGTSEELSTKTVLRARQ